MTSTLGSILARHQSDKATYHGYERFYETVFEPFRDRTFNMLEIGLEDGASLRAWLEYFPKAHVYVMDIKSQGTGERHTILQGDQSSLPDLERVCKSVGKASIVIDDGSHVPEHQLLTFNTLFPNVLEEGGWFVLEDIETSYWTNGRIYQYAPLCYGRDHPLNLVNVFTHLLHDTVNAEYDRTRSIPADSPISAEAAGWISQILFGTNCILIRKKTTAERATYDARPYRFQENMS